MNHASVIDNNEHFIRHWYKMPPMKYLHETLGIYSGSWSRHMDRYWESNDGYTVSSRLIQTPWGSVEHVSISHMNPNHGDIPWSTKQQIKNELFGTNAVAIEVFPAQKNLIDTCDVYHIWILPKHYCLPFGLHPRRDPQCQAVERGYDFDMDKCVEWNRSPERKRLGQNEQESF